MSILNPKTRDEWLDRGFLFFGGSFVLVEMLAFTAVLIHMDEVVTLGVFLTWAILCFCILMSGVFLAFNCIDKAYDL